MPLITMLFQRFSVKSKCDFFFFCLFRATSVAYVDSQVRGQIRSVAAGLCHSPSNTGSELHLQTIPQLMAIPDP